MRRLDPIPLIIFLAVAGIYMYSTAPTLTIGDSGELMATAYRLDVSHAPGMPLYNLAGNLFMRIPAKSRPFCLNFLSGFGGAVSALILFVLIMELIKTLGLAGQGGKPVFLLGLTIAVIIVSAAASVPIWTTSTFAEIYSIKSVMALITLWLAFRWYRFGDARHLLLVSLSAALGACVHVDMIFLVLPILFLMLLRISRFRTRRWAGMILMILFAGLTILSLNLYLPLRSSAPVPLDQGVTSQGIGATMNHITGRGYRERLKNEKFKAANTTGLRFDWVYQSIPWLFLIFAAIGLAFASVRDFGLGVYVFLPALLYWGFYSLSSAEVHLFGISLIILYINTSIGLAAVFGFIRERTGKGTGRLFIPVITVTVMILTARQAMVNFPAMDRSRELGIYVRAREWAGKIPHDSIIFATTQEVITSWVYLQHVIGARRDLALILPVNFVENGIEFSEEARGFGTVLDLPAKDEALKIVSETMPGGRKLINLENNSLYEWAAIWRFGWDRDIYYDYVPLEMKKFLPLEYTMELYWLSTSDMNLRRRVPPADESAWDGVDGGEAVCIDPPGLISVGEMFTIHCLYAVDPEKVQNPRALFWLVDAGKPGRKYMIGDVEIKYLYAVNSGKIKGFDIPVQLFIPYGFKPGNYALDIRLVDQGEIFAKAKPDIAEKQTKSITIKAAEFPEL